MKDKPFERNGRRAGLVKTKINLVLKNDKGLKTVMRVCGLINDKN